MSSKSKKGLVADAVHSTASRERTAADASFPIVAIGASSGGLKALETFLRKMPPNTGIAYVLAMHLSPEHESDLAHILQAFTTMPVTQVSASVEVVPDHLYVISPRQHLSLRGIRLNVSSRGRPPSTGVIDHLFQSLAVDRREKAIGIVLSGSGADGTMGLQSIKERGGLLLAQDPDDAEFAAMPRSIISTGLVDFVLPAAEMPARLIEIRDAAPRAVLHTANLDGPHDDENALFEIIKRLHAHTGYDFSHYKRTTLLRQIGRRMLALRSDSLPAYARRVKEDVEEVDVLFRHLLVSVTRFFRDTDAFQAVEGEVIPGLFQHAEVSGDNVAPAIRLWVPGCATGEEVYSFAMLLDEYRDTAGVKTPFHILATDIDEGALAVSRNGRYSQAAVAGLSPERLERFFVRKEGTFQVIEELRSAVLFATHDLTCDPPFAHIDLLSCRNLLMYFEPGMQQQVLERCAFSLRAGGYLFLGTAEGTGGASRYFAPVQKQHGLYKRTNQERTSAFLNFFPASRSSALTQGADGIQSEPLRFDSATTAAGSRAIKGRTEMPPGDQAGDDNPTNAALILANREMQALNQELRSMMEELEVAKEEMHSLNEELTTVNQELQNKIEEHRRVNSDLHMLIESTHLATLFLDRHLNVVLYTPETATLFNLLPIDIGRPLEHLSHRLTYSGILEDARQVLESADEVKREVQTEEGSWYAMRVMPYPTANGPAEGVVLTFADITAQKQVEQVSEDRFSLAFHAGPMAASIVTRADGCFLDVNEHFDQITGYRRDDVIGKSARSFGLFFGDDLDPQTTDEPGDPALDTVETRIRTRSGALHDLVVSTTAIDFGGQPCYLSLFYDVTERKRLEREILLVSDREQRRIGVDLHDGLGTHLTGVALMARGLARNLRAGRTVSAEEMDEIARLLGEGIEQARSLAQGLNPFLLEVRGLTMALRELATNMEAQTGITCTFEEDGDGMALSSEQSMHLYRITQEALTNAARHAQATRIRITLSRKDQRYRLIIRDNGTGIQTAQREDESAASHGMGLSIMRYRAEMIGARLDITDTPGGGTSITCMFRSAS